MSSILHESWLSEVVAERDRIKKLNTFEESYLAWRLLLRDETLVQEMKYEILSFAFLLFLWDNSLQERRIPSYFAKCEQLIRILICFEISSGEYMQMKSICSTIGINNSHLLRNYLKILLQILGKFKRINFSPHKITRRL